MRPQRIHIFGASGSGTTTLGRALAAELGLVHLDSDDFFWEATDPPYSRRRPAEERQKLLREALDSASGWSLSGWLGGWSDLFLPRCQAAIFLHLPPQPRLERLQARERQRHGAAIAEDGPLYQTNRDVLAWAAGYDANTTSRNRAQQEAWLTALPCPALRLDNTAPIETTTASALNWLRALSG